MSSLIPTKIERAVDYNTSDAAKNVLDLLSKRTSPIEGWLSLAKDQMQAGMSQRANEINSFIDQQEKSGLDIPQIRKNLDALGKYDANDYANAKVEEHFKNILANRLQEDTHALNLMQQQKSKWEIEAQRAAAEATELYASTGSTVSAARPIYDSLVNKYKDNPFVAKEILAVLPKEGLGKITTTEKYDPVDATAASTLRKKAKVFDNYFKRLGIERDAQGNLTSKNFRERAEEYIKSLGFEGMDAAHVLSKAQEAYNAARAKGFTDAVAADAVFRSKDPRSIFNPARWFGSAIDFDVDKVLSWANEHRNDPIYELDAENIIKLLDESKDLDKLIIAHQDSYADNMQKVLNSSLDQKGKELTLAGMKHQDYKFNKAAAALLEKLRIATNNLNEEKLKEMYPYLYGIK